MNVLNSKDGNKYIIKENKNKDQTIKIENLYYNANFNPNILDE